MAPSPKKDKKRSTKWLTLSEKLEIITMRENGAKWSKIASDKKVNESTIRSIFAKKDEIKSQGKFQSPMKLLKLLVRCRYCNFMVTFDYFS